MTKIQAPDKELRFTRSGQAALFWMASAMLAAVGVTLLATSVYRATNPELPHPLWALLPLTLSVGFGRLAVWLTRHAYLILTPLGLEIFPFYRPAQGMQLVMWQELDHSSTDHRLNRITLHRDAAETSGIHLSLQPICRARRTLLAKAIQGRLDPVLPDPHSSRCAPIPDKS
jgi:lysylphosphatidylglycerol synthetase-like protein (DUF2156 family)